MEKKPQNLLPKAGCVKERLLLYIMYSFYRIIIVFSIIISPPGSDSLRSGLKF